MEADCVSLLGSTDDEEASQEVDVNEVDWDKVCGKSLDSHPPANERKFLFRICYRPLWLIEFTD
jgi:hypothetical protein